MNTITEFIKLDFSSILLGVFLFFFTLKEIIELVSYFKKKCRIKTGVEEDQETLTNRIDKLEKNDNWQYNEIIIVSQGINDIKDLLNDKDKKDKAKTVATLRNQLYDLHQKFIIRKSVDKSGLKTFLELGQIYEEAGGNDVYHDKLKPEVMDLPIKD